MDRAEDRPPPLPRRTRGHDMESGQAQCTARVSAVSVLVGGRGDHATGVPSDSVPSVRALNESAGRRRGQHNTVTAARNTIRDVQSLIRRPQK